MILLWLILVPLVGGIIAWMLGKRMPLMARWVSLLAMTLDLILSVQLWREHFDQMSFVAQGHWFKVFTMPWIPQYGISLYLAMDGVSLLMVVLTALLGIVSVIASWTEIQERIGFFHFNLLWVLAGVTGVFLSLDLFLFYFFWEMMLIPMYFLIAIWGHEHRIYASTKFFIFTQASGLLMLLAILGLYFVHYRAAGVYTFRYDDLLGTTMTPRVAMLLMLGFFVAFAVKLPAFPFHPWLPDAHTEAPTAGSVVLAGLLLKTGAYGLIRFVLPLFHDAAVEFAPIGMTLGVVGIAYGAILAFGQHDLKRLVAYTSVSHLGFVLLGVFAWNTLALQGVLLQMICHGFSTGALFVLVGTLQERIHTRDMRNMGGMWETVPRMGAIGMFFALASMGLPGLGNFVAEFLVLLGSFQVSPVLTIIATGGLIAATVYSLWIIHRTFYCERRRDWKIQDLSFRHLVAFGVMILALLWIGLFPQPVLDTAKPAIDRMESFSGILPKTPATQTVLPASTGGVPN